MDNMGISSKRQLEITLPLLHLWNEVYRGPAS